MKRALRWVRRIVLFVLAFAVFATAVLVGAIHTTWGKDYARGKIVAALRASFPGTTIRSLEGSPFGTLVLRGVVLGGRDGKPLATIDEIAVEVALRPLVHKQVVVESLAVAGVEVFVRDEPPPRPEPATPPAPSEPSAWSIDLPSIAVDRMRVTTTTEHVDDIALRAAVRIPAGGAPLAVDVTMGGTWRGAPFSARALAAVGDVIEVPLASARYRSANVVATSVRIADQRISGAIRAFVPASLVRDLAAFDLPGDAELVARAREGGAIELSARSGPVHADAWAIADLATLSGRGIVHAAVTDLAPFTAGKVTGGGTLTAAIAGTREHASGLVAVDGDVPQAAGNALLAFDATLTSARILASARATRGYDAEVALYAHVHRAGTALTLEASNVVARGHHVAGVREIAATVTANGTLSPRPALAFAVDLDARGHRSLRAGTSHLSGQTTDRTLDVVLGAHRLVLADGRVVAGSGGTIHVDDDAIVVDSAQTSVAGGRITASARIERADMSMRGRARASGVPVAAFAKAHGTVDADVTFSRSAKGALAGKATLHGHQLALPDKPVIDGDVTLALAGRRVTVTANAGSAAVGHARVDAIVRAPASLTNPRAWMALPRSAAEKLTVTLDGVAGSAVGATGRVDGELALGGDSPSGALHVHGVATSAGDLDGEMTLAASSARAGALDIHASAGVAGVPSTRVDATVAMPARVFDPAAWIALGRDVLVGVDVATGNVHIDPALLSRFGVMTPYEADVAATVRVGPGARTATVTAEAHGLRGGKLTRPIDASLTVTTDATGTHLSAQGGTGPLAVTVEGSTPVSAASFDYQRAANTPIDVKVTLPALAAHDLLAMVGETDVVAGTVSGEVTVTGTVADPAVHAELAAKKLALRAGISRQKPPTLDGLTVDARYRGGHVQATIMGQEAGTSDRLLKLAASGDLGDPRGFTASIEAANFDIAPLVALAPGRIRAARGTLTAALKIRGIDPTTGSIHGQLALHDARFPLSPELGTLRRATIDVEVVKNTLVATFDGRLGAGGGSMRGKLTGVITGGLPTSAHLDATLSKVSPIGALQPVLDATVVGDWKHAGGEQLLWNGTLTVDRGKIFVPPATGDDLLLIGAPTDMVFVDRQRVVKWTRRPPTKPWVVTHVTLRPTDVDIEDEDYRVRLTARGHLDVTVGNGLGVTGTIATTRGDVDVLGKRYRIDTGVLDFDDGTIDPRLDIRIVRDLRTLTLTAEVHGRASNPLPVLTSDPGGYTQGQLLSYFLGAEPDMDDSTAQQNEAVVNGSLALVTNRLTQRINKRLPVKLDAITYEPGTASSSSAVRVGLWRSKNSYLVWRQHIAARPDENPGEALWEYQFRPSFLFEATIGEISKGGDFLWRTRW